MPRVTMANVARAAGVDKGTVSRALRGDRRVSKETRERVWVAAKDLGYELDAVASGLSSRRTGIVGVVVERLESPWAGMFLAAASGVLSRFKMEPLLFGAGSGTWTSANVVRRVEGRKAEALIWVGERPLLSFDFDIPVVRAGRMAQGARYRVWIDEKDAVRRVSELAGDRPRFYRSGNGALMGFLHELESEAGAGEPFTVYDGAEPESDKRPGLVCADERYAQWLHVPCLRFPARELGVLTARLAVNSLRGRGVCPRVVFVRAPLISASGEPLLGSRA